MANLFAGSIPNFTEWGQMKTTVSKSGIPHTLIVLKVDDNDVAKRGGIVKQYASMIAACRLSGSYYEAWLNAATRVMPLPTEYRPPIAKALSRGIMSRTKKGYPRAFNDNNLRGHMVEVMHSAIRYYINSRDGVAAILEPAVPKANPTVAGIDLLEVGCSNPKHFCVWECKGTDTNVKENVRKAASQLCSPDGTACQSFMEAHKSLSDSLHQCNQDLRDFIEQMPLAFYSDVPDGCKRLGLSIGLEQGYAEEDVISFVDLVAPSTSDDAASRIITTVVFSDFAQLRKDVYDYLWAI